jgi:hypothetical protein
MLSSDTWKNMSQVIRNGAQSSTIPELMGLVRGVKDILARVYCMCMLPTVMENCTAFYSTVVPARDFENPTHQTSF